MQPLSLTLTGFKGVRSGLGRDTLSLDVEALAGDATLVAIAGANGRGKTTVMDNLHPVMLISMCQLGEFQWPWRQSMSRSLPSQP